MAADYLPYTLTRVKLRVEVGRGVSVTGCMRMSARATYQTTD